MLMSSATSQAFRQGDWPLTIAAMRPQRVYAERNGRDIDGLYIMMGRFFVAEWGFFVPANKGEFRPTQGSDPSFELLDREVYWYEIKG